MRIGGGVEEEELRRRRRRRRRSLFRIIHARGAIPNEVGGAEEVELRRRRRRSVARSMRPSRLTIFYVMSLH